jgi:superfamily II DNA/RNA helicase
MDLPYIKTIVQWKATCDLCTLWQRFGRAARGHDAVGTAVLLVEKKDTDEERVARAERAAKRKKKGAGTKRKATDFGNLREKSKRPALVDRSLNYGLEDSLCYRESTNLVGNADGPVDSEPDAVLDPGQMAESEFKKERRVHYRKQERTGNSSWKGKSRTDIEVGSPMYDFINAHAYVNCRRIVPEVYFGNDQTREFLILFFIQRVSRGVIVSNQRSPHL